MTEPQKTSSHLTLESANFVIKQNKAMLESLTPHISRKLVFILEEKIGLQEKKFMEILQKQTGKQNFSKTFSLVLDPQFFEQKLFSETE